MYHVHIFLQTPKPNSLHIFENHKIRNSSVIAIKTHQTYTKKQNPYKFKRAILIVRDPVQALQAEFNRQANNNQTGYAPDKDFNSTRWKTFVKQGIIRWETFYTNWHKHFPDPSNKHVVFYDDLIADTRKELQRLLKFLNLKINESQMNCVIKNKEGFYHRQKKKVDSKKIFDKKMLNNIKVIKKRVYKMLKT